MFEAVFAVKELIVFHPFTLLYVQQHSLRDCECLTAAVSENTPNLHQIELQ